jgi:hypothetical protein
MSFIDAHDKEQNSVPKGDHPGWPVSTPDCVHWRASVGNLTDQTMLMVGTQTQMREICFFPNLLMVIHYLHMVLHPVRQRCNREHEPKTVEAPDRLP